MIIITLLLAWASITYFIFLDDLSIEGSLDRNPDLNTIFAGPYSGITRNNSPSSSEMTKGFSSTVVATEV